MKELSKTTPKLEDFPPKLRKLANTIIETIKIKTLKDYCELANVNYDSVRATIPRLKRKGIDFNVYMNNQYMKFLIDNKLDVSKSVVEGAMSGTSADKKLYFQLTGDLVERQQVDHNVKAKIVVFSPGKMPDDVREKRERETDENGVQIIDTTFDD